MAVTAYIGPSTYTRADSNTQEEESDLQGNANWIEMRIVIVSCVGVGTTLA